jgi:hypothetical protein
VPAKIILDSINSQGDRLTTMEVTFHRFVLAEFNTHRAFSRNSASSRAIPVEKQLKRVAENPALPLEWASEIKGMQGGPELDGELFDRAAELWIGVRDHTVKAVEAYVLAQKEDDLPRLHKSLLNRLLEPFMWHTVIVSSTEWQNFFDQRCSPLAQPEIRDVAEDMRRAYEFSDPQHLERFDWHTPYIQPDEANLSMTDRVKVSAARCARVSYLTHDGERDIDKDLELFDRLVSADPPHWSPLEHVARPVASPGDVARGNFSGWEQLRHLW